MSENCSLKHNESHGPPTRKLAVTLVLVFLYFLAEVIGGFWTGSLALLADAGHMFSDMAALAISLFAAWVTTRSSSAQQTFGHHRAEILAAAANGASLFLVAGGIIREAWERLQHPQEILSGPTLIIAIGGLVINLIALKVLHGGHQHNLNLRGAWLHVVGDTLGSVGVIVAIYFVWQFHWNWADPVASVMVCVLILYSSWKLLRDAIRILMEYAPSHVDVREIEAYLTDLPKVTGVHCLHVWVISSGLTTLSAHLVLSDGRGEFNLNQVSERLRHDFRIDHITLQIESQSDPVCAETDVGACLTVSEPHTH